MIWKLSCLKKNSYNHEPLQLVGFEQRRCQCQYDLRVSTMVGSGSSHATMPPPHFQREGGQNHERLSLWRFLQVLLKSAKLAEHMAWWDLHMISRILHTMNLCGRTGFLYHGLIRFLCISIFGISIIRSICPVSYLGFRPKLECLTLGPGIGVDR